MGTAEIYVDVSVAIGAAKAVTVLVVDGNFTIVGDSVWDVDEPGYLPIAIFTIVEVSLVISKSLVTTRDGVGNVMGKRIHLELDLYAIDV